MSVLSTEHGFFGTRHRLAPLALFAGLLGVKNQRAQLRGLDPARLDDIGISPAQAQRESRRPVWDAPDHWRR